ncbi:O-antigen ligase family protein [Ruminococcus flavefaciens]|uniref:O-antigen ligase-like membrane protein n=1 Tax=Ruminococcus flavefaciens TaxID=1265 RepID=A0A315Y391_RUMFL|nr:O-antigen ligase family protein [Ruminococcus flavefaciens]PWJ14693.1 O-antigen ligase-like membrane protein [Ruminococcus flavefaciens]SSA42723.1 O-antigen ligase like membrane protein [Ruminococcus flavefaciens]
MRDKAIYAKYSIIFTLWFLANTVSSPIGWIALVLSATFIIFEKDFGIVRWIFFVLPNIRILDVIGFTSGINLLLIVCSLKLIFTYTTPAGHTTIKTDFEKKNLTSAILVFVIELSHSFLPTTTVFGTVFNSTNIVLDILAGFSILSLNWDLDKFRKIITSFYLGVFSSVIIFLIANPNAVRSIMISAYRLGAYGTDPNYLSVYVILSMAGILFISIYDKIRIYELISLVLLFVVGLLTASKMCMICMVSVMTIYVVISILNGNWKQFGRVVLGLIPVVIIGLVSFKDSLLIIWNKIADRFDNTSLTSGRNTLFDFYLEHIGDNLTSLLFGRGIGYFSYYQPLGAEYIAHNTYLDFLLSWGIVGCFVFVIAMLGIYKEKIDVRSRNPIDFLPILILSVMLLSLSCMSSDMFWFILPYCFIPMTLQHESTTLRNGGTTFENKSR